MNRHVRSISAPKKRTVMASHECEYWKQKIAQIRRTAEVSAQTDSQAVRKSKSTIHAITTPTAATVNLAETNSSAGNGRIDTNGGIERSREKNSGLANPLPTSKPRITGSAITQKRARPVKRGSSRNLHDNG